MNVLKKYSTINYGIALLFSVWCCYSFTNAQKPITAKKNDQGKIILKLNLVFNEQALLLGNKAYINASGDSLIVDEFKCYISTLRFFNSKNQVSSEPNSYHLINAEDSSSLTISVTKIPAGNYIGLNFNIGIDSTTSVSGALDGALDPTKGMFWAWNTGYIAAKLQGRSKKCNTLHHAFEYHIGGYLQPYHALRNIDLKLQNLKVESGKTTVIELKVDVAEWFKTPYLIDLSKTNNVVLPNKEAITIATNYSDMFSVSKTRDPF
ncbi:MAG: MbnP family protein [Bacteroidota bacterium]